MRNNACILYLHHSTDALTVEHYNLVKKHNPDKDVYPVGFANHSLLDNSHVVFKSEKYPQNDSLNKKISSEYWSEADLLIYDFYLSNPNLPIYFILEYDTYCNCSIEKFYGHSLNMDAFSHIIHTKEDVCKWDWHAVLSDEQKKMSGLGGMSPTSGLLFKNSVLSKMLDVVLSSPRKYDNMFSELRLGTLLQQCGYILKTPFINSHHYINWNCTDVIFNLNEPGYYHPVKNKYGS